MGLGSRIRDPGSGKNLFRIPESKRHRIPDPQHWLISYLRHLFEYIGTQFPPPSSLLYGKMGSITLFFFSNGNIKNDTTFYAYILIGGSHYFTSYCNESGHICET